METNFKMVRELDKEFTPKETGILSEDEVKLVEKKLCLSEMDILGLRNLRDFTVMFLGEHSSEKDEWKRMDKVSAVTAVIDTHIFQMGGEV